ncbi:hypothetical protein ENUP19_0240G0026 [Entamoeba nuttalli]|uniref:Swi5 protein n=1 Tax=Entamoeba nuttalli TaxID=412467 RepID=A0ABQ0DQ73_9EUKA
MKEKVVEILEEIKAKPQGEKEIREKTGIEAEIVKISLEEMVEEKIIKKGKKEGMYYYHTGNEEEISKEIIEIMKGIEEMKKEIERYEKSSEESMEKVHKYNEIKDIGQEVMGRKGQMEGKTIEEIYKEYGMGYED